ncbi:MAG: hypothetical protein M1819_002598 [Sarea resinae]|nr:MAG: hypothetical protein M1819_002598 [Sarea resinae]
MESQMIDLPSNLDRLPFDLLYQIASYLNLEDFVCLSKTNRLIGSLLLEESVCRRTAEVHTRYSKECGEARRGVITYQEAILRTFDRRRAFATGQPRLAAIIAFGSSFIYQNGVLCYMVDQTIRILNIHKPGCYEQVIESAALVSHITGNSRVRQSDITTPIGYSENVLVCSYEVRAPKETWLLALYVDPDSPHCGKVLLAEKLDISSKLFARHNSSYLYFGTLSEVGIHGHREWLIRGFSLHPENSKESTSKHLGSIWLRGFLGSDIGRTAAFEIYDGYLYGVSTQGPHEISDDDDWASFYHCLRFPLENPSLVCIQRNKSLWRRFHVEGPINDSWTDLCLNTDEMTGDLLILEARREWQGGGSTSQRSFYRQVLHFASSKAPTLFCRTPVRPPYPAIGQVPVITFSATGYPPHSIPQSRLERNVQPEFASNSPNCPSFILAKTRFRTYNPSCSAFLDIVDDPPPPTMAPTFRSRNHSRLRMRIGSRRLGCPLDEGRLIRKRPEVHGSVGFGEGGEQVEPDPDLDIDLDGYDEHYDYWGPQMWPPDDTKPDAPIWGILNAGNPEGGGYGASDIDAVADERSLMYMPGSSSSGKKGPRPIVLVSFDETIKFLGLARGDGKGNGKGYFDSDASCQESGSSLGGFEKGDLNGFALDVEMRDSSSSFPWYCGLQEPMFIRSGKGVVGDALII